MDFQLPEAHRELGDLAATILGAASTPERHTALEQDGWLDRDLWQDLAEAGLLGLLVAEDLGGLGLDLLAGHVVLREAGASAAHVPLAEHAVVAATALAASDTDLARTLSASVASGEQVVVLAPRDEDGGAWTEPTAAAESHDAGWRITGTKALAAGAPVADTLVLAAQADAGPIVVALPTDRLTVELQRTPADVPHGRVVLDGLEVSPDEVLAEGERALALLADAHAAAVVAACGSQVGHAREALALAARHTSTREQFGRPIATFQAVSQRVADARIALEMLELTSLQAAWLLGEGLPAAEELLVAQWWAVEAGHEVLHAAHHVHGGIGVDREYPLWRLFGRTKLVEAVLGGANAPLAELGARLAAQPAPA